MENIDIFRVHKYIRDTWCSVLIEDSGTLLGMTRDGKLLEGDNDLDYLVLSENLITLEAIISDLKRLLKISPTKYYWKGNLVKVKFRLDFDVDINICYKYGDYFGFPVKNGFKKSWFSRYLYYHLAKVEMTKIVSGVNVHMIPEQILHEMIEGTRQGVERYLSYRYGDWHTPAPDWNYLKHDGAFNTNE